MCESVGRGLPGQPSDPKFDAVWCAVQIPIAMLGLLFFDARWSPQNVASILVGLLAGVIFVRAKQLETQGAAPGGTPKADLTAELRPKAGSPLAA